MLSSVTYLFSLAGRPVKKRLYYRGVEQLEAYLPHTQGVGGSNPSSAIPVRRLDTPSFHGVYSYSGYSYFILPLGEK